MNDTTTPASYASTREPATGPVNATVLSIGGLGLGLILLILAFATLDRMPGWADDYGAIPVYLAFFLYMSIAGRLTWWAIDSLAEQFKARRG